MKLTDLFVKRPVLAVVVNLVILIAGLQSIRTLAVRQYPRSDIAVVKVSTVYVGANADLVRGFITTPLEIGVRAHVDGRDLDHRDVAARVLPHRERTDRLQAGDQDDEVHDHGEDGTLDE